MQKFLVISVTALAVSASLALASRCFAEEAPAAAATADHGVYQVLRPGDRALSCEQLAAEANSLNAAILAQQKAPDSGAGRAVAGNVTGGLLKRAGRFGLGRLGPKLGAFGFVAARAASDTAADAAGQSIANGGQPSEAAAPTVAPEQQRMNHLLSIYKEKGC